MWLSGERTMFCNYYFTNWDTRSHNNTKFVKYDYSILVIAYIVYRVFTVSEIKDRRTFIVFSAQKAYTLCWWWETVFHLNVCVFEDRPILQSELIMIVLK